MLSALAKRYGLKTVLLVTTTAFLISQSESLSSDPTTVTFTNGCPQTQPYEGEVSFQFFSASDEVFVNLPAGASYLVMPEEPVSMTINGSTAYTDGAYVNFDHMGKTGLMWFDKEGNLWHAEI